MGKDDRLFLLTGDLGYGLGDKIKIDFPDRFQDFGSSEQLMVAAACGLATEGHIPLVYSITPFVLYRPYEFIRNYINHEKIPVKLLGGGRDKDYGTLGFLIGLKMIKKQLLTLTISQAIGHLMKKNWRK